MMQIPKKTQLTTRVVVGLTAVVLILGYVLIVTVRVSTFLQLFGLFIASYLTVWGGYAAVTTIPRAEIRNQFLLTTFSVGVALVMLEFPVWLKLVNYREIFAISDGYDWEQPGYVPDKELLFKPKSNQTIKVQVNRGNIGRSLCLASHSEEPFELIYDKNGFRNEKDLAGADIAVIGDSYIESQMMPGAQLVTTRLAELTKQTVANLGQSGYGPQQELAVLKRFANPLHPKTIVWVFYEGNDLLNARGYSDQLEALKATWGRADSFWYRSFTKNSLAWLTRSLQDCIPIEGEIRQTARTIVMDSNGEPHQLYVKGRSASTTLTAQEWEDLQKVATSLDEAYQLALQEGARFMVVFAPVAYRVYHDINEFEDVGGGGTRWALNDLPDRLHDIVTDISPEIDYLDLTPALQSAARKNTLVFLPDDTHWTADGHQVVAETLAQALTDEKRFYVELPVHEEVKKPSFPSAGAFMIRSLDGTIRYWSKGAQKLYGWEPAAVQGAVSHQLLKTVFPMSLAVIEKEVRVANHWEGPLIHQRRDGSNIVVSSRWRLLQDSESLPETKIIVEVNREADS